MGQFGSFPRSKTKAFVLRCQPDHSHFDNHCGSYNGFLHAGLNERRSHGENQPRHHNTPRHVYPHADGVRSNANNIRVCAANRVVLPGHYHHHIGWDILDERDTWNTKSTCVWEIAAA